MSEINGPTMLPHDHVRIAKQRATIFGWMCLGGWWTLADLADQTGFPEASISARLRDFRKSKYGSHTVDRRRALPMCGLWEYRLTVNKGEA